MSRYRKLFQSLSAIGKPLNAALSERDSYTEAHCTRVVFFAEALGRECGLDEDEIGLLKLCAAFHDIGKIGIPDRVLFKAASFDDAEWEIMKTHPLIGERIIRAIAEEGADEIANVVRHHHEHFDGSGYPDGLAGEDIPLYSRLLSIVDSYDAMVTARPYHLAREHSDVMGILRKEEGGKHDPELLDMFSRVPFKTDYLN